MRWIRPLFYSGTTVSEGTRVARTRRGRPARSEGRVREAQCRHISAVYYGTFYGCLWSLVVGSQSTEDIRSCCADLPRFHWDWDTYRLKQSPAAQMGFSGR